MMKNNNNISVSPNTLRSSGVSLTEKQWDRLDEIVAQKHYPSRNDLMREIVDFYLAAQDHDYIDKFLTPALESVLTAKVRDSEERTRRVVYKLAVQVGELIALLCDYNECSEEQLDEYRAEAVRMVNQTNGTFRNYD